MPILENNDKSNIVRLSLLIRRRELSPVELTNFFLERIHKLQPVLNAYITIAKNWALRQAEQAEKEISGGCYRGPLHGIPINIKDIIYTQGVRTTAGSRILKRFVPKENAAVIERLLKAGAIILGKASLHEFAFGITNINPHYGPARNPWDPGRVSGGSSGGSAVTLPSAMALASVGTDKGGSIRIAQMRREKYTERLSQVFQSVDALAAPTIPIVAPRVEENELVLGGKRESMRSALLRLTRPGNLSGLPAITLPCGFSREGLPVGLQLIGKRWDEAMVLRMAFAFEQATDWHRYFPCEPSGGI